MTTTHARSLLAEASRFAERLGVRLALVHATTDEAESQAHLREAANQLTIPVEKHIIWSKSDSAQALVSAAEQAGIELLVAGAFEGPALNRRRFLSSAARKMVDSARCSLLLLVQPRIDTHNFRRVDDGWRRNRRVSFAFLSPKFQRPIQKSSMVAASLTLRTWKVEKIFRPSF